MKLNKINGKKLVTCINCNEKIKVYYMLDLPKIDDVILCKTCLEELYQQMIKRKQDDVIEGYQNDPFDITP